MWDTVHPYRVFRKPSVATSTPEAIHVEIYVTLNFRHSTPNSAQRTHAAESHWAQALRPKPSSTGGACHRERRGSRIIRLGSAMSGPLLDLSRRCSCVISRRETGHSKFAAAYLA